MRLDEHFCLDKNVFCTFEEIRSFCIKFNISTARGKQNLASALYQMGAVKGKVKWKGKDTEDAFLRICLTDHKLWSDRDRWGLGVEVKED